MTEKCPICKEHLWEWKSPHYCNPIFYVWEAEGGGTFTDAYDLNGRIFAKDAEEAATAYFCNDFERSEIEVYVLSDKDAEEVINDLSECDQTKEEIARLNDVANKLADCYTLTAEVVREVSAKLKTKATTALNTEWACSKCGTTNMLDVPVCQACFHPRG